ncbi:MAG: hypothetical protein BRD29_03680 [Bacteroidetes bacterium QH_2_67_10]|jgi:hypothetical protein|nr:MAG: hypothetical protein BRD29_03680 [Bacteroidetes bacterium QH_2_67_10]
MANESAPQKSSSTTSTSQEARDRVVEEVTVRGNQLVEKFKEIVEKGNARRVIVKREGETVMEIPLTAGVGGAAAAVALSPTLAALGAFASLATDIKLVIEKKRGAAE